MKECSLSIIVPIYNMALYLEKCIDSILMQAYKDYELILVDDGSTDGSSLICDYYKETFKVKVIHKENGGLVNARQSGMSVAVGKYIGFVDADDWIESDMYENLMIEVMKYDADIVSCGYFVERASSVNKVQDVNEKIVIENEAGKNFFLEGILATDFDCINSRKISPSICNKVFRKQLLQETYKNIDNRIKWDEDTVTVLSAVLRSKCIVLIPCIFYHYRQNESSMSHLINKNVLSNYVYVFNELEKISTENGGILEEQIPYFSLTAVRTILEVGFGVRSNKHYMFPFAEIKSGCNIVIYGAGNVGRCYYKELSKVNYASHYYITDSNPDNWHDMVISPDDALKCDYDIILIAVDNENTANKIKALLTEKGVSETKIFWRKPIELNDTYTFNKKTKSGGTQK